ncbi:MAG: aldo/keto reductase [Xanthobacteraceae bacterium]|nr:aldo/keto reductase [Xanthobacteraceae bacterium]QYK43833.1 MAG: aldo/keto reductase [Xanthobacteraceae bacterium]
MAFTQTAPANGANIPLLGLGTWQLRDKVCSRIVEQALRLGYRHIDTAQAYENEREVGEGVRNSGLPRNEIFVTTKVWYTNLAPADVLRSARESLARLKLDYVDLLLIHWPNASVPLDQTLSALCKAKRDGITRNIGISNFPVALVQQAVQMATEPIAANQIEMHVYLDQSKVKAACEREGIAVTAYSPIAKGSGSGDPMLAKIGRAHGKSEAQICLRYLVQQGVVVIPRTSKLERLSENAGIFDFELSEAEMTELRGLARPNGRMISPSWAPEWDS